MRRAERLYRALRKSLFAQQARTGPPPWETRGWPLAARIGWYIGPRRPDGCRDWTGPCDTQGYPILRVGGRRGQMRKVARIILGLERGNKLIGMHSCDRPICVEPTHLRADTQQANVDDMIAKGRSRQWVLEPGLAIRGADGRILGMLR